MKKKIRAWAVYTDGGSHWGMVYAKNREDALKEARYNGCKSVRLVV